MTEVLQPGGALPGNSFLCGLLGAGIAGSRSPELHETEARALGLPLVYRILDGAVMGYGEAELPRILTMLGQMGFAGVNVTHPFKQAVVPLLDHLSDAARVLGAVNTVVWRPEGLFGDNTDWSGYRAHFLTGLGDKPRETVAMIGAGGAAAAVGFAHLDLGARDLRIVDTAPSGRRLWPRGWARFSRKRASPPARMPPTPWPGLTAWCRPRPWACRAIPACLSILPCSIRTNGCRTSSISRHARRFWRQPPRGLRHFGGRRHGGASGRACLCAVHRRPARCRAHAAGLCQGRLMIDAAPPATVQIAPPVASTAASSPPRLTPQPSPPPSA
jgi:hypothetical protein